VRSGVILVAARGVSGIVQLGSTILLARLLNANEYSIVAILIVVLNFAPMLIDFGSSDASAQRRHITNADISAPFFFNIVIISILMLLLIGAGPFIASVYGKPVLTDIALASSSAFMLTALSRQHYALPPRAMQFRRIAPIEIFSNVVSSIVAIANDTAGPKTGADGHLLYVFAVRGIAHVAERTRFRSRP
jgi:PST family polysaccharide transporter